MIYSADIKRLFPRGTEIRSIALKDQLVDCRLQIHCLAEGSLDPLVVSIFERLSKGAASIESLTKSVDGRGRAGIRTVAQTLLAMEQAGEVEVRTDQSEAMWSISNTSCWSESSAQEVILQGAFQYLPRPKDFGPYLPATRDLPTLPWWDQPDENDRYSDAELSSDINEACARYYSNTSAIPNLGANRPRSEPLQRASLLSVKLRFLGADIIEADRTGLWSIHRCFLGKTSGEGADAWNIVVGRYPRGYRNYGYEQYFERLKKVNPQAVVHLSETAIRIE